MLRDTLALVDAIPEGAGGIPEGGGESRGGIPEGSGEGKAAIPEGRGGVLRVRGEIPQGSAGVGPERAIPEGEPEAVLFRLYMANAVGGPIGNAPSPGAGGADLHTGDSGLHTGGVGLHTGGAGLHTGGSALHIGGAGLHTGGAGLHIGGADIHTGGTGLHTGGSALHSAGDAGSATPNARRPLHSGRSGAVNTCLRRWVLGGCRACPSWLEVSQYICIYVYIYIYVY